MKLDEIYNPRKELGAILHECNRNARQIKKLTRGFQFRVRHGDAIKLTNSISGSLTGASTPEGVVTPELVVSRIETRFKKSLDQDLVTGITITAFQGDTVDTIRLLVHLRTARPNPERYSAAKSLADRSFKLFERACQLVKEINGSI